MANWQEQEIRDFGQGLITNASAVDQDKTSFREFTNLEEISPGLCTPLPGSGTAQIRVQGTLTNIPALPSGFTLEKGFVWHATTPGTGSDYVVIFGSKSSRDRFYVWPDIDWLSGGTWSTTTGSRVSGAYINWRELTEAVSTTITTVTTSAVTGDQYTIATASDLDDDIDEYYRYWWIMVFNGSTNAYRGAAPVASWTAATRVMTTGKGVTGVSDNDYIIIMRSPIFKALATPITGGVATLNTHYQIDNLPEFVPHGNALQVFTGAHDINSGPDLWIGYVNRIQFSSSTVGMYLNGWCLESSQPWEVPKSKSLNSISTPVESTDPIPWAGGVTTTYLIHHTFVYDGIQESNIYWDAGDLFTGNHYADTDNDVAFQNAFSIDFTSDITRTSPYSAGSNVNGILSRRVSAIRVYMAQANAVSGSSSFKPTTPFFFVKELSVDPTVVAWSQSGVTGEFTFTYTLYGRDWLEGQKYPFSLVNGYELSKVGANGSFGTSTGGRSFVAPIYDDTQKLARSLFSPLRLSGENGPEVYPIISRIDTLHHGIYEITGLCEQYGRLLVFGRSQLVVAGVSGESKGQIDEAYQKVGCVAYRTIKNLEGMVFFLSERRVEIFDGNKVIDSPFERIRDIFDDATLAQKEAAFAGVHRNRREYWIAITVSGAQRIFIYSLVYNSIKEYDSSSTYIDFVEGANGELFGLTSSTIVELASGTPTESLVISLKSQVYNHQVAYYRRARIAYKSASAMTFYHLDETLPSGMQELDGKLLLAQTELDEVDIPLGMRTGRSAFRLARSASTDTTLQIDSIVLARTPQENR